MNQDLLPADPGGLRVRGPDLGNQVPQSVRYRRRRLPAISEPLRRCQQGGTLKLRTYQQEDRAYVEVSDTGTGLTPEECERLFTPYYTSKEHGTGLGLAIVQSVVSDHGGRISVQSQAGHGTTFVIELPRKAAISS